HRHDLGVDLSHGGKIEPEARVGCDHDVDLAAELASKHRALDIASGKLADRGVEAARLDLVSIDLTCGAFAELGMVEPPSAQRERRSVEIAEGEVVGKTHPPNAGIL